MDAANSGPTITHRYRGSKASCASISRGVAASKRSLDPAASPVKTMT